MYNTKDITKKITSLTLMAIMVAGGMTFAVPGIMPAAEAANANLFVSAENSQFNNYMAGPQVIEVVIIDSNISDTDESKGEPDVTVNGRILRMVQAVDGNWYGYFADQTQVETADLLGNNGAGLDFGDVVSTADAKRVLDIIKYDPAFADREILSDTTAPVPNSVDFEGSTTPGIRNYNVGSTLIAVDTITTISNSTLNSTHYAVRTLVQENVDRSAFDISDATGAAIPIWTQEANDNDNFNVIREAKEISTHENIDPGQVGINDRYWPFVQLYTLTQGGNVVVQYNKGGGAQTTTLTFDTVDGFAGIDLDRRTYPRGAQVHVTVTDAWLNIDPTDEDSWTWYTAGDATAGQAYYQIFDEAGNEPGLNNGVPRMAAVTSQELMQEDAVFRLTVDQQGTGSVIQVENNDDSSHTSITGHHDTLPVTLTERGPNSGVFGSYDESDVSVLRITDEARRGTSAVVDYNDSPTTVLVAHDFATIDIQPPNDGWSSGEAIPIVLVDADANKNSRADEDLTLSNPDTALIPALVTGNPFTLGEGTSGEVRRTITSTHNGTWTDALTDADDTAITAAQDIDVATARFLHPATPEDFTTEIVIERFSDRAMVQIDETTATDERISTTGLIIDLGVTWGDLVGPTDDLDQGAIRQSSDNADNWNTNFKGFNLFNYDLRSLAGLDGMGDISISVVTFTDDASRLTLEHDGAAEILVFEVDDSQGLRNIPNDHALFTNTIDDDTHIGILYEWTAVDIPEDTYPIVTDFFSFGFGDDGYQASERVANQIIRLELEEDADNSGKFIGTLEYTMLNQLNILDPDTYTGLTTISDEPSFIVMEDLTDEDAPRVNYLDLGRDGVSTQIADQEEAPSHSGVVTLDSNSYKVADTVTVTLSDPDLNVDSDLVDIFTVVDGVDDQGGITDLAQNAIGEVDLPSNTNEVMEDGAFTGTDFSFGSLGRLLDITFNDQRWTSTCGIDGLHATGFTLIENGTESGIFTGDFQIPAEYCNNGNRASVTGTDIEVNYVDFRDASGEIIEVGDSAGVRANTGSVSLDRTVYPVPWGTPAQSPGDTGAIFPVHSEGWDDQPDTLAETLGEGVLTIHVRINDPDFDVSASGEDTIAQDVTGDAASGQGPLKISVSRGSEIVTLAYAGGDAPSGGQILVNDDNNADGAIYLGPINEVAPDAGIFELDFDIRFTDGPSSRTCPPLPEGETDRLFADRAELDAQGTANPDPYDPPAGENHCVLQGDILTVEYTDPTDASGDPNTVTDSATFDLRNGVLQSDKSVYIIGSDMILTVIEPDWDLDNDAAETYDLDVIEWDSDAATVTMGDLGGEAAAFDPEPTDLRETGDSTGIFQVVIEIPEVLDGDRLERGEEISLEYTDWGPSGADYVGQEDEDVNLTVFTSNFGATIELDQKVYSWTDKVYITIVAPDHNFDSDLVDEIGETGDDPIRIATRGIDIDNYRLVETGTDTGIFTGEVILTGFLHDADGDSSTGNDRGFDTNPDRHSANDGPTNGFLPANDDDGLTVSFEFSEDETVVGSALIRWNIGEVQWLEQSYPASGSGVLRVVDPDMNLNPESVDNFAVDVWSDTDSGGIDLTVTETNEATGIFEGTVQFTITDASSGHRLRVSEGDTITGEYDDNTLPSPYNTSDQIGIKATSIIGTIVPPLERAPASQLRTVDTLGNALDSVSVDQQVQITADLVSGQDKDQEFAYIVQVQDSSGVTVELAWITGTLSPGQSFSPSKSWVPTMSGTYTATAFVWESVSTPTALSPPAELTITVN